jgi:hypothetical protein
MSLRYLILFTIAILCQGSFQEAAERKLSESLLANTEGIPSSVVDECVSAITGDFVDSQVDIVLPGPEPLVLQRSYCSSDNSYSYLLNQWILNYPSELTITEIDGHKLQTLHAVLGEKSGARIAYQHKIKGKEARRAPFVIPLKNSKGMTNCV